MKITQRRTRRIGWNSMTALALLCLAAVGGQRAAIAADPGITPSTVEVVPYQAGGYRYSVINYATQTTRPNVGFEQPEFNDSAWSSGQAGMGSGGYCGLQSTRHSDWPVSTEIYVRRKVMIPAGATNIRIMAAADNDILAYFDGIPLGGTITHEDCPVLDEFRLNVEPFAGTVEAGEHTLAFYIKDRGNQSFFDMRLLVDVKDIALTTSSPDFIIYRNPSQDEPAEPTIPEVSTPDEAEYPDSGGSSFDDGDIDEGIGDGMDGPTNVDSLSDSETAPPLLTPPTDNAATNPTINFGVRIANYQSWHATITVYPIADGNGSLGNPIATLVTTETSVTWNQLFPNEKPSSGVYFYDIVLEGVLDPNQPLMPERIIGLTGAGKEPRRIDPSLTINELQFRLLEEDDQPLAAALSRPRIASTSPRAVALLAQLPETPEPEEQTVIEVKFRLSGLQASEITLSAINPQLQREYSIPAQATGDGWYRGLWTLDIDDVRKMGDYILVANARSGKGNAVPGKKTSRLQLEIAGYAIGFEDGSGNSTGRTLTAGTTVNFRAFIRMKKPGSSSWKWYSGDNVNSTVMGRMAWIGGWTPNGYPTSATKIASAWRNALSLKIEWRKFANNIVDELDGTGRYRWYGFDTPTNPGNDFLYPWKVADGVSWWGARIVCNGTANWKNAKGKYGRWIYQFPTDQKDGKQLYLAGKAQFNTVAMGHNGRIANKVIWSPSPAATSSSAWRGLISVSGLSQSIALDRDDPFFEGKDQAYYEKQAMLQGEILRHAVGFINTPYGWGGQTLGGLQSRSSNKQSGNVTYSLRGGSIIDVMVKVNDSRKVFSDGTVTGSYRTGFGIDCNGLVTEAAYLAGLRGTALQGDGAGTGGLMSTGLAQTIDDLRYVSGGDFVVWQGHIVYVWESKTKTIGDEVIFDEVKTLEANGDTVNGLRGRARYDKRSGDFLRGKSAVSRRWKAQ